MNKYSSLKKINWRHIFIHSIAFIFLLYAFKTFAFLYDTNLLNTVINLSEKEFSEYVSHNHLASGLVYYVMIINISGLLGLFVCFILSMSISRNRHWFWTNSLIALLLIYILYRFNFLGWDYIKPYLWYPGKIFNNIIAKFLFNGMILLFIGVFVLLFNRFNAFIQRGVNTNIVTV